MRAWWTVARVLATVGSTVFGSGCLEFDKSGFASAGTDPTATDGSTAGPVIDDDEDAETTDATTTTATSDTTSSSSSSSSDGIASDAESSVGDPGPDWDAFTEPVALRGLNTADDDRWPSLRLADNNLFCLRDGKVKQFVLQGDQWVPAVVPPLLMLDGKVGLQAPRISADGNNIWFSHEFAGSRVVGQWAILQVQDQIFGTPGADETEFITWGPRREALVVSNQSGSMDLHRLSRMTSDDPWAASIALSDANTDGQESSPAVTEDGSVILFVSDGYGDGKQIYRLSHGTHGDVVEVEEFRDDTSSALDVWLSPDGSMVLLTRESASGDGDIYMATR